MSLSVEDRAQLKDWYQAFDPNKSLEPDSPFYEPIYTIPGSEDPVQELQNLIDFSVTESMQLFSGFRGAGKTTELKRLKQNLEQEGHVVVYANALDYLSPADPVEIQDLLTVLAGSFGEQLAAHGLDALTDSYWGRFWNFLNKTEVQFTEFGFEPGSGLGVSIKGALKSVPTFRQKVSAALAPRLGEFRAEVHKFIQDSVEDLRQKRGDPSLRVTFLFDQLEQIRGTTSNESAVYQSLERVFTTYPEFLRLPEVHAVYTVPPWLKLISLGPATPITVLPCIRQWHNDDGRTKHDAGCDCLRRVLQRRFGADGEQKFFGDAARADKLINLCGGHFRDLLRFVQACILRAKSLPIGDDVLHAAIQNVRSSFLPIAQDDAIWLHSIARERSTALKSKEPKEIARLTRLLDTHFVLYLRNGEEWYDVHPLIREEVDEIAQKAHAAEADG